LLAVSHPFLDVSLVTAGFFSLTNNGMIVPKMSGGTK
jgi:hypothetical protein